MANDRFRPELDTLRAARDELRVQLHLAGAEARDRFEELERRWHRLEGKLGVLADTAAEDAHEVGDAVSLLLHEIREGYEHLRKQI